MKISEPVVRELGVGVVRTPRLVADALAVVRQCDHFPCQHRRRATREST